MKKLFTFFLLFLFSIALSAQDAKSADMKNFRFGGTVIPSLCWYKPDNLKKFKSDGSVARFGVLINVEYSFSGNFAFGFGVGLTSAGGKLSFIDTARYFYSDDAIISPSDTTGLKGNFKQYKLNNRIYRASYYVIPISLKMRTKEIGYMRYFFQPSININVRKKVRADDNLSEIIPGTTGPYVSIDQPDLDITKDMGVIRFSTTLSAGAEYYVSGSTAIVFSIGYDYGLSNAFQKESEYLIRNNSSGNPLPVEQKFTQDGVTLTVGILF
ncbi:MAG: outer membrane beta-barrel protein [Bacteroidota bacterium]